MLLCTSILSYTKGDISVPNIKSQIKRVEISAKENANNSAKKTRVKNAIKKFNAAIDAKDIKTAEALLPETVSLINCAKSDGVFHANTAARKIASLNKFLHALQIGAPILPAVKVSKKPIAAPVVKAVAAPVVKAVVAPVVEAPVKKTRKAKA